jgi:hypothetical protein
MTTKKKAKKAPAKKGRAKKTTKKVVTPLARMSKQEARVAIAKDALTLLEKNKIIHAISNGYIV